MGYDPAAVELFTFKQLRFMKQINEGTKPSLGPGTDVVGSFSIPDTRIELLEYMSDLRPHLRVSEHNVDIYEECVRKAKRLFPDDPLFRDYIDGFEASSKKIRAEIKEEKEERQQDKEDKKFIIVFALLIINTLLGFLLLRFF